MSREMDTPQPAAPPWHRKKKVFEALQNEWVWIIMFLPLLWPEKAKSARTASVSPNTNKITDCRANPVILWRVHVSSSKAIRHRLRMTTIQIQGLPKRARNIGVPPSCSRLNISSMFRHSYGKWPIHRWLLILPIKNADFAVRYVPALSILMLELLLLEVPPTPEHKWKSRIPSKTQYIFAHPTAQERYYNYIHNLYTIIS